MTSVSTSHSDCSWIQCSGEVNGPSRPSLVLRRSKEKRPSQLRPRRGPPSRSYCNSSRRLEACGSSSRLDVPLHPQPVTKLHPDKSRKHLPLQKTPNHNWVVAILDETPIVTSGPRSQHWPLQTIRRAHSSLTDGLKVR